jgi:hypothetical protein
MSKKHDDPRGKQKGPQGHAEGQHGDKAHQRFLEELQAGSAVDREDIEQRDLAGPAHPPDGGHRLFEGRHQNDPAERAGDKNRLDKDIGDHKHERENFQVRGGARSHTAGPDSHIDPTHPDRSS